MTSTSKKDRSLWKEEYGYLQYRQCIFLLRGISQEEWVSSRHPARSLQPTNNYISFRGETSPLSKTQVLDSHVERLPTLPKQPSNLTATAARQAALNILALPTLFQVHQPYVQVKSTLFILMEEAKFSSWHQPLKVSRDCRNGSVGKVFFLKASVHYNKATIASVYLLIQKDLFMRDLQSA